MDKPSFARGALICGISIAMLGLLTSCAAKVEFAPPDAADPQGVAACQKWATQIPEQVLYQDRVPSKTPEYYGAAWGPDPRITVQCGQLRDTRLGLDCLNVNGVDWLVTSGPALDFPANNPGANSEPDLDSQVEPVRDAIKYQLYGRDLVLDVTVPFSYELPGEALIDLAASVQQFPVQEQCQ